MKVKPHFIKQITEAVQPLDTPELRERYRQGNFPRSEQTKDLNMRYRWDLYWLSKIDDKLRGDKLWKSEDYNANHIDTVLRRAVPIL